MDYHWKVYIVGFGRVCVRCSVRVELLMCASTKCIVQLCE